MRRVDHRYLLLLRIGKGEKLPRQALNGALKPGIDAVVNEIKKAAIAGSAAKIGQKGRFFSRIEITGKIQNGQGKCAHGVLH